ncbi:glycoside/pentoside/hexuronide:cation symporter, GPH family [Paenibacillus algorifonticola]|uniref:Glycoside/pentoside/hexuronide:cation symporter, GPH family n=1 Tax=Paenibacillus algorifonticola TaxID=684063 RepID=A0A1I2D9J3_9BACL|nr:MFS transporter [Paenibacillus algorifonticola]SFE76650.1 glycoside/pentoside/hexuronide:cation symporter, GPH family [Paenibacillus algorifonticola]
MSANQTASSVQDDAYHKVRWSERIGYGFGDAASNLIFTGAATFLTYYYTDVMGLAAGAIGTMMLIARILDAFLDVGVGALVDKTKNKHGKARPWLLWMMIPFAASGVLLFTFPDVGPGGALVYAYVTYLLMNFIYSFINIPYGVLNSLVTQDGYQRSVLNIVRMLGALAGAIGVSFATQPLVKVFGGGEKGWILTFAIYGVLSLIMFFITFKSTRERVKPSVSQKEIPFKQGLGALFRNKYWAIMLLFAVTVYTNYGMNGLNIYYAQYMLNDAELLGLLSFAGLIPIAVGLFLIAPLIKKYGKRNVAFFGSFIMIVGSLVILIDPTNVTFVIVGLVIKALGMTPILGTIFAMLADTVEYGEWKTGVRTEGLVYSAGSFGTKAGSGLGAAIIGWGLAIGGYIGGQETISSSASSAIHFMFIYLPIILGILQMVILYFHKLDKLYPQIVAELKAVKKG